MQQVVRIYAFGQSRHQTFDVKATIEY